MSQPTPLPVPKSASDDARQRAIRSYLGGLLVAVLAAVLPILQAAAGDIEWSSAWWLALLNAVASPALYAVVAYVGRHVAPPQ
jgi:hypothetical protein